MCVKTCAKPDKLEVNCTEWRVKPIRTIHICNKVESTSQHMVESMAECKQLVNENSWMTLLFFLWSFYRTNETWAKVKKWRFEDILVKMESNWHHLFLHSNNSDERKMITGAQFALAVCNQIKWWTRIWVGWANWKEAEKITTVSFFWGLHCECMQAFVWLCICDRNYNEYNQTLMSV